MRAISPDRLTSYQHAAAQRGCDVLELYVWDRDLAAAAVADIAILEVAMRNALSHALAQLAAREDWYATDLGLDNRSTAAITRAWKDLPAAQRTPGRVVAQLMFGFWRNLLEAGGDIGEDPRKVRADYERLWRAQVKNAFPGGRPQACERGAQFTHTWTLAVIKDVHDLRNRAAHHEPLVNGFPLPGEQRRLSAAEGHQACLQLARLLDRDPATWLEANSHMSRQLPRDPALRRPHRASRMPLRPARPADTHFITSPHGQRTHPSTPPASADTRERRHDASTGRTPHSLPRTILRSCRDADEPACRRLHQAPTECLTR
ncbi:hypothetical protein [Kineococcus sp. SYSU DK018]|uniref:hypothetical protein n=1 Tax=Kineococcus sp. SYSU DK018 TaxID=3383139 RepID=UPI003D7CA307